MVLTGFDPSKLTVNMEAIRERMESTAQRKAVVAGARVIGAAMIERTPVLIEKTSGSDSLEPGEIKANIKVRTRMEDGKPVALVGPSGMGRGIGKIAHNVEYGHRMVTGGKSKLNIAGLLDGGGKVHTQDVPAHPFLRPAYEASANLALDAMAVSLAEDLKKGAK
jgi:HK97 gp10 family phage protein